MPAQPVPVWSVCQPYLDLFFALHKGRAWDGGGFGRLRPRGLCAVKIARLARLLGVAKRPHECEEAVSLVGVCDDVWRAWHQELCDAADAEDEAKRKREETGGHTDAKYRRTPAGTDGTQPLAAQWKQAGVTADEMTRAHAGAVPHERQQKHPHALGVAEE